MHLPLLTIKMFYSSSLTSVLTTGRSWDASYGAEYPMAHCCVHMGNSPQFEKYDYFIHLSSSTEKFIMCYKLLNLQMLTNLNLKTSLWSRRYHYPHFKEKETKAWDDKELARDHSPEERGLGSKLRWKSPRGCALTINHWNSRELWTLF